MVPVVKINRHAPFKFFNVSLDDSPSSNFALARINFSRESRLSTTLSLFSCLVVAARSKNALVFSICSSYCFADSLLLVGVVVCATRLFFREKRSLTWSVMEDNISLVVLLLSNNGARRTSCR